jgi:hypothetical protein
VDLAAPEPLAMELGAVEQRDHLRRQRVALIGDRRIIAARGACASGTIRKNRASAPEIYHAPR